MSSVAYLDCGLPRWVLQVVIFSRFFNSHWTWLYALSLPITGYFALFFRDKFKAYKRDIYQAYVHLTRRPLILTLKKDRLKLIRYLDEIKDEYLAMQEKKSNNQSSNTKEKGKK